MNNDTMTPHIDPAVPGTDMTVMQCPYRNDGERITQPGKFEGCPVFAPYFWDIALEGFADSDDGKVFGFRFSFTENQEDRKLLKQWPTLKLWLGRKRSLKLWEDSQGFVHCA